ncbi:MAG: hypothetical protein KAS32_29915, partial [Candidatus Peribacteraceae bacterium]|nr:hypothetical protein [Candidatus Peribacteraceae bacterium]
TPAVDDPPAEDSDKPAEDPPADDPDKPAEEGAKADEPAEDPDKLAEDDPAKSKDDDPDPDPDKEPTELEKVTAQNAILVAELEKASSPVAPVKETAAEETEVVPPPTDLNELFEGIDFDKVIESKENFVGFLKNFAERIHNNAVQASMTNIPGVVGGFVSRQNAMKDVAKEFYSVYPELKPVKGYASKVANEVHAENPDMKIGDVLTETAKRVKATLNLVAAKEKEESTTGRKRKPGLPGTDSATPTRSGKKTSKGLQDDIDDFLDDN